MDALLKEAGIRKSYFEDEPVETIYFGGGTPSLLTIEDCRLLIEFLKTNFRITDNAEITIEVNPDDITGEKLRGWKDCGINRLSIGIQSFFEEDLKWMNRAHNASQSIHSLEAAVKYFDNISVDLIYGGPYLTNEKWKENVDRTVSFGIPHLSCYALTVEEKTPLHKLVNQLKSVAIDPDKQSEQFILLMEWMDKAEYEHYEISNFAQPGYRSRHNSSYWSGKKYLGLGPSAHSFNGSSRQWNISNNKKYIDSLEKGIVPFEIETLTKEQKENEYIMTSLRRIEGLDLNLYPSIRSHLEKNAEKYIAAGLAEKFNGHLVLTKEGKLLADGIAADLFISG